MEVNKLTTIQTLLNSAYRRYCANVPGCEEPPQDRPGSRMINATANFFHSPSKLSCPPNYNLLSCGLKNAMNDININSEVTTCDRTRYAIPDDNNGCECKDNHGSNCVAWCTALKIEFEIVKLSEFWGVTTVYCPSKYEVV